MTDIASFVKKHLLNSVIKTNEPLKPYTTFKIGGNADWLFVPASIEDLQQMLVYLHQTNFQSITILGKGSNMLISDKGIRGLVILIDENISSISVQNDFLTADAGVSMKDASYFAAQVGLSGLEFSVGIPGNIGGGIFMNAGAYDSEFAKVVDHVLTLDKTGVMKQYTCAEASFAYRHSLFQDNGEIIIRATFKLTPNNPTTIHNYIQELTEKRESKQPLDIPSAGSTFKRPTGFFAGTMIDQAGLKGYSIGGAQVSTKHAGFIVNKGNATAQNVLDLIAHIQKTVYNKFDVHLESEVRFIGEK